MVAENEGTVIDFEIPDFPGLDKFVEEVGDKDKALKILWADAQQADNMQATAIRAHQMVMKMVASTQKLIPFIATLCGKISQVGYKNDAGQSLVYNPDFIELVNIGQMVKAGQMVDKLSDRRIIRVKNNPDKTKTIILNCGHEEKAEKDDPKEYKVGDPMVCPGCMSMAQEALKKMG